MDKPLTPAEDFADALSSLVLALETLRDALDVLASEILVAPREVELHREHDSSVARRAGCLVTIRIPGAAPAASNRSDTADPARSLPHRAA
jgi:hypothetical protein